MSRYKGVRQPNVPVPPSFANAAVAASSDSRSRKKKKMERLEQWIEVRIVNGLAVTRLYPSNENLLAYAKALDPFPQYMYRRINFPDGIPSEYNWVGVENEEHRQRGGCGLQRMTVKSWQRAIQEEARYGDGHIGPVFNLPHANGECDCQVCRSSAVALAEAETKAKAANQPYDIESLLSYLTGAA